MLLALRSRVVPTDGYGVLRPGTTTGDPGDVDDDRVGVSISHTPIASTEPTPESARNRLDAALDVLPFAVLTLQRDGETVRVGADLLEPGDTQRLFRTSFKVRLDRTLSPRARRGR